MRPGLLPSHTELPAAVLSRGGSLAGANPDPCLPGRKCVLLGDQLPCDTTTGSGQVPRGKDAQEPCSLGSPAVSSFLLPRVTNGSLCATVSQALGHSLYVNHSFSLHEHPARWELLQFPFKMRRLRLSELSCLPKASQPVGDRTLTSEREASRAFHCHSLWGIQVPPNSGSAPRHSQGCQGDSVTPRTGHNAQGSHSKSQAGRSPPLLHAQPLLMCPQAVFVLDGKHGTPLHTSSGVLMISGYFLL